jgi:mannan endo-1,4-beta-mannosidase
MTLALLAPPCAAESLKPADPDALPKTRAVLAFLSELPQRKDHKLISGQFPEWYPRASLESFRELQTTTGQTPGILSLDYFETFIDDSAATEPLLNKPARWQAINPLLVKHWNDGGLVTLSVHMTHPWTRKKAWEKSGDLKDLVVDGKPAPILKAVLDPIADGLADLQKQGVVVIFRPYHELTSNSFWWSGKDSTAFKAMWCATFQYFTETKKLHNLLWTYNPMAGCGKRAMDYYPGASFVDIVGLDIYSPNIAGEVANYELLKTTGKPFALTEFGPGNVPFTADTFANATLNCDYGKFPELLLKHFPDTVFFVAWRGPFSLNKNLNAKTLFANPLLLNLEQLAQERKNSELIETSGVSPR